MSLPVTASVVTNPAPLANRISAIDASREMIETASALVEERVPTARERFEGYVAFAAELPFDDGAFDAVDRRCLALGNAHAAGELAVKIAARETDPNVMEMGDMLAELDTLNLAIADWLFLKSTPYWLAGLAGEAVLRTDRQCGHQVRRVEPRVGQVGAVFFDSAAQIQDASAAAKSRTEAQFNRALAYSRMGDFDRAILVCRVAWTGVLTGRPSSSTQACASVSRMTHASLRSL